MDSAINSGISLIRDTGSHLLAASAGASSGWKAHKLVQEASERVEQYRLKIWSEEEVQSQNLGCNLFRSNLVAPVGGDVEGVSLCLKTTKKEAQEGTDLGLTLSMFGRGEEEDLKTSCLRPGYKMIMAYAVACNTEVLKTSVIDVFTQNKVLKIRKPKPLWAYEALLFLKDLDEKERSLHTIELVERRIRLYTEFYIQNTFKTVEKPERGDQPTFLNVLSQLISSLSTFIEEVFDHATRTSAQTWVKNLEEYFKDFLNHERKMLELLLDVKKYSYLFNARNCIRARNAWSVDGNKVENVSSRLFDPSPFMDKVIAECVALGCAGKLLDDVLVALGDAAAFAPKVGNAYVVLLFAAPRIPLLGILDHVEVFVSRIRTVSTMIYDGLWSFHRENRTKVITLEPVYASKKTLFKKSEEVLNMISMLRSAKQSCKVRLSELIVESEAFRISELCLKKFDALQGQISYRDIIDLSSCGVELEVDSVRNLTTIWSPDLKFVLWSGECNSNDPEFVEFVKFQSFIKYAQIYCRPNLRTCDFKLCALAGSMSNFVFREHCSGGTLDVLFGREEPSFGVKALDDDSLRMMNEWRGPDERSYRSFVAVKRKSPSPLTLIFFFPPIQFADHALYFECNSKCGVSLPCGIANNNLLGSWFWSTAERVRISLDVIQFYTIESDQPNPAPSSLSYLYHREVSFQWIVPTKMLYYSAGRLVKDRYFCAFEDGKMYWFHLDGEYFKDASKAAPDLFAAARKLFGDLFAAPVVDSSLVDVKKYQKL